MAKKTLLLVDGDVRSLRVLEVSLRKAGYNLTTCGTSQDALETLEYAQPDLIVTDTRLPGADGTGMDGFDLVEALRKNADWAAIPIMFLSSDASVESKVRGLQLGVEDYLTKPIYTKEILARIHLAVNRRERDSFARGRNSLSKTRFTGSLEDMGLIDLLQTIDVSRKSGVLELRSNQGRGTITFRDGQILDAELGPVHAERAVYRLLLWSEGDFDIEFRPVRSEPNIQTPTTGLLMEGMRRVDEWGRLLEQVPPLDTVVEVVHEELLSRLAELPDELNPILRTIDGHRTLGDVVDFTQGDDLTTLSTLSKLFFEGVVQPKRGARTLRPDAAGHEEDMVGTSEPPDRAEGDTSGGRVPRSASIIPASDSPDSKSIPPNATPHTIVPAAEDAGTAPASGSSTSASGRPTLAELAASASATAFSDSPQHPSSTPAIPPPAALPSFDRKRTLLGPFVENELPPSVQATKPDANVRVESKANVPTELGRVQLTKASPKPIMEERMTLPLGSAAQAPSQAPHPFERGPVAAPERTPSERNASERKEDPMAKKNNKKNKGGESKAAESKAPPKRVEETVSYETKKSEAPQKAVEVAPKVEAAKVEAAVEEKRDEAASNVIQFPTQTKRGVTAIAVNGETTSAEASDDSDESKPRLRTDDDKKDDDAEKAERAERRKRKSSMSESSEMRAIGTGEHAIVAEEFFTKPKKKAIVETDDFSDLQPTAHIANPESRQWMIGTIGMFVAALVAFGGYYYYSHHVMPQPVALGHAGPATPGQVHVPTPTHTEVEPVVEPTVEPTVEPVEPTVEPTVEPVVEPGVEPVVEPSVEPTVEPAVEPVVEPVVEPAVEPAVVPSATSYEALLAQAREARRPTLSIPLYEQAIAVNPTGAEALSQLAYILVQRPGRDAQERARDLATRATASDATSSLGWLVLGASQEMLGHRTEARAAYQSCIDHGTGRWVSECRASRR